MLASTLLILCGACSAGSDDQDDTTGVSDELLRDSAQFQLASGLFRLPELATASRGTVLATAPYAEALGRGRLPVLGWQQLQTLPVPAEADLPAAQAYLAVERAAGQARLDEDDLRRLSASVKLPAAETDIGAEVGSLAAYARARDDLNALGGTVPVDRRLSGRLAALDATELDPHPYLLYQVQEAYRLTGQPVPAALVRATDRLVDVPLAKPNNLQHVLDAVAVLRTRHVRGLGLDLPKGYPKQVSAALADDQLEDLSRASLLQVLVLAQPQAVAAEVERLRTRVDPVTGLLVPAGSVAGTVDSTYLFARLLDSRFAEVANDQTRSKLVEVASARDEPLVRRLEATLALKNAGSDRWQGLATPLLAQVKAESGTVTKRQLPDYLSEMGPAVQLDPDITKKRLRSFDPGYEVEGQKLAAAAVSESFLFANEEQVGAMFAPLQKSMKGWLTTPVPFPQLMTAAATLPSSRVVKLSSDELDRTSDKIVAHQGCAGSGRFFSVDGEATSTCSVVMTLLARSIPGVPS